MDKKIDRPTALIMDYERKQGRNPDFSGKHEGYDIKSDDRFIEVKGRKGKAGFCYITKNEYEKFLKNKDVYLYLVYESDGKPKLKIFDRDVVLGNSRMHVRYRFQMPKAIKELSREIALG